MKLNIVQMKLNIGPSIGVYCAINKQSEKMLVNKIRNGFYSLKANGEYEKYLSPTFDLIKK